MSEAAKEEESVFSFMKNGVFVSSREPPNSINWIFWGDLFSKYNAT